MNLSASIKYLMSEGTLEWTSIDAVTGAEEATLPDGSKFVIQNITGTLNVMFVAKGGVQGNVIYRTPAGVPMAFKKAKQEAEKFLGIKKDKPQPENEELSKYTKKYHQMYGEETAVDESLDEGASQTALANKAKKSGVSLSILKKVYSRGVAAWKTSHRPGTNPQQWGMARVNSYITKGKTYNTTDKDLREAITGAEQVALKSTDKLEVKDGSVLVNGRPFDVTDPDESLDWPKSIDADGNLVTWFKGRASNANTWSPEEISGHYTDAKQEEIESKPEIAERYIKTVQLITKESDRQIIEAFLTEHSIEGRECDLLAINTEFKRFKKLHSANLE